MRRLFVVLALALTAAPPLGAQDARIVELTPFLGAAVASSTRPASRAARRAAFSAILHVPRSGLMAGPLPSAAPGSDQAEAGLTADAVADAERDARLRAIRLDRNLEPELRLRAGSALL